jgi:hypothetical protein
LTYTPPAAKWAGYARTTEDAMKSAPYYSFSTLERVAACLRATVEGEQPDALLPSDKLGQAVVLADRAARELAELGKAMKPDRPTWWEIR